MLLLKRAPSKLCSALCSALTVCLSLAFSGEAIAAPSNSIYQAAISLYNTGKYAQALSAFEAIARQRPTDDTAHYYIGLCCQSLHQNTRAAIEYRYVASASTNAQLRQMAQRGYDSVARLQTTAGSSSASSSVSTSITSSGAASSAPAGASTVARGSRVKKIIEFYTTWCHVCTEFADTFEKTKSKYSGRIQFDQLNAEDPENSELKAKYNVKAYPTLIYLDASGTVLRRGEGAPMGPNFGNIIDSL